MKLTAIFRATFNLCHSERDNYDQGCDPESSQTEWLSDQESRPAIVIEAATATELQAAICAHFGISPCDMNSEDWGDPGRVDVQLYSRGRRGVKCTLKRNREAFKAGQIDLYLVTYTGTVQAVAAPVDVFLCEAVKAEQEAAQ